MVAYRHRGLTGEDLFIASFPRSGNTWVRFVLADLATDAEQDFESVERAIPNVGWHACAPALTGWGGRMIKTHEPHRREYRRAIYLVRDFRDVLISAYRAYRPDPDDLSELDQFVDAFGSRFSSPYGAWVDHVRSWTSASSADEGIAVHRFEDLRADPVAGIRGLAEFAGISTSEQRISAALARNTSEDMRQREHANLKFLEQSFGRMSLGVREGAAGRWQQLLTDRHLDVLAPELELNRELGYE